MREDYFLEEDATASPGGNSGALTKIGLRVKLIFVASLCSLWHRGKPWYLPKRLWKSWVFKCHKARDLEGHVAASPVGDSGAQCRCTSTRAFYQLGCEGATQEPPDPSQLPSAALCHTPGAVRAPSVANAKCSAARLWRAIELQRSLKHVFGSEIAHADWLFLRAGENGAAGSEEAGGERSSGDAGPSSSGAAESDSDAASVSPCSAEDPRCPAWALHALGIGSVGAFWEC